MAQLNWLNPYTNQAENNIMVALADKAEMKTLHMITADPARTPTFTPFADPDWFFFASNSPRTARRRPRARSSRRRPTRASPGTTATSRTRSASTWVGCVGPGVKNNGDDTDWTDHTDVRPTMLCLLGLTDDYVHDGRVLIEAAQRRGACPQSLQPSRALRRLGDMLKQLDAPFGRSRWTRSRLDLAIESDHEHGR